MQFRRTMNHIFILWKLNHGLLRWCWNLNGTVLINHELFRNFSPYINNISEHVPIDHFWCVGQAQGAVCNRPEVCHYRTILLSVSDNCHGNMAQKADIKSHTSMEINREIYTRHVGRIGCLTCSLTHARAGNFSSKTTYILSFNPFFLTWTILCM